MAPLFSKVRDGKVIIKHKDGFTAYFFKELSDDDIAAINQLSDGPPKLYRPILSGYDPQKNTYKGLTLSDGSRYQDVCIKAINNDQAVFITSTKELSIPLTDVALLPGISNRDHEKVDARCKEIAKFREANEAEADRITALKAAEEARKRAEEACKEAKFKDSLSLHGQVFQLVDDFVIICSLEPNYGGSSVGDSLQSMGGGGGYYSPPIPPRPKHERIYGLFAVVNYPGIARLADQDQVQWLVSPTGGTRKIGGRTLREYQYLAPDK